jgi:hypothetical protein
LRKLEAMLQKILIKRDILKREEQQVSRDLVQPRSHPIISQMADNYLTIISLSMVKNLLKI